MSVATYHVRVVLRGDELVLGPFQGKPACVHIDVGAGVCGTAAATSQTQRVADVHQFEGHIACDAESRSEVVVPLISNGQLIGVLDIDSPTPDRFTDKAKTGERTCYAVLRKGFLRGFPAGSIPGQLIFSLAE